MTAPLLLVALSLVLGGPVVRRLESAEWPTRAPGLAIVAWQALTLSIFGSLVLAGLVLAVPQLPETDGIAAFIHACSVALREHYSTPGGSVVSIAGGAFALVLVARLAITLGRDAVRRTKMRRRHLDLVGLVCSGHDQSDVVILEHYRPVVYCVPGRAGRIVVSRGALEALNECEMRQVLAHERAHLRSRHHLAIAFADSVKAAMFGRLGTSRARAAIADLAEMHADDSVALASRRELASAVVRLVGAGHPAGALAAHGGSTAVRIQRLITPMPPTTLRDRVVVAAAVAALVLLPVLIAGMPAAVVAFLDYCPVLGSSG